MDCALGKYKNHDGDAACSECAEHTHTENMASSSSVACLYCGAHSTWTALGTDRMQCECDAGYAGTATTSAQAGALNVSTQCTPCEANTYKEDRGNGGCDRCVYGTFSASEAAASADTCVPCSRHTYGLGAASCFDCAVGTPWQPELWTHLYAAGTLLPPAGVYCAAFCALFPTPPGLRFSGDCALRDVDECRTGMADCDQHAHCKNLSPLVDPARAPYSCRCDPHYFVVKTHGTGCERSGIEFTLFVVGNRDYDSVVGADSPSSDVATMSVLCSALAELLVAGGYTKAGGNGGPTPSAMQQLLLEGITEYPAEFVREVVAGRHAGRGLWRMKLRLAMSWANVPALVRSTFMYNGTEIQRALGVLVPGGTGAGEAYAVPVQSMCANDRARSCVRDGDCLRGAACLHDRADAQIDVRTAGGSGTPIQTVSAGMQLLSVKYDSRQSAWLARVRYNTDNAGVADVLYLSHVAAQPPTADELASFRSDEFPCLPPGPGAFQQLRDDSVCCLPRFASLYTPTQAFAELLAGNRTGEQMLPDSIRACGATRMPPQTHTIDLVTAADYVTGPFARMARSHASLDTTVHTRGYRDVLLVLDAEDMRNFGGIEQAISGGYRLRFLVGMAQLRGLHSDRLSVAFSHTEVTTDVTQTYTFATSAQSDATFVKDVNINLMQVRNELDGSFVKFARVQLTLPQSHAHPDTMATIHTSSARAVVAFSRETAPRATYPCVDTYSGARGARIDEMLRAQQRCAIQAHVCVEQGGAGSVYYTFPLADDAWTQDDLIAGRAALAHNLYLDFMLSVQDRATGQMVSTRVQTSTPIQQGAVASLCDQPQIRNAIKDLLEIDLFLGLTDSADSSAFNTDLVQSLDVTRAPAAAAHMGQPLSSRKANILTMLIKADPVLFEQDSYQQSAVEVEDMFTIHFLDTGKKAQVEALVAADAAFKQVVETSALARLRLEPTDALLMLCPIHATRGVFGCVTRIDVQGRRLATDTYAIVDIAPNGPSNRTETFERAARWTQAHLGESVFAANLGASHAKAMAERFSLNNRYRRGFMISPTIPWRQTDMHDHTVASLLDIAQYSITAVMITIGQRHALLTATPNIVQRRRALLSDAVAAPEAGERPAQATVTREITGIDSNDAVSAAVCLYLAGTCRMFEVQMLLAAQEYCLEEHDLIAWTERTVGPVLRGAGHGTVAASRVTSVIRPRFLEVCRPLAPAGRRMLLAGSGRQPVSFNVVLSGGAVLNIQPDHTAMQKLGVFSFRAQTSRDASVAAEYICEDGICSSTHTDLAAVGPTVRARKDLATSTQNSIPTSSVHSASTDNTAASFPVAVLFAGGVAILALAGCVIFYAAHGNSTPQTAYNPPVNTHQTAYSMHQAYTIQHTYTMHDPDTIHDPYGMHAPCPTHDTPQQTIQYVHPHTTPAQTQQNTQFRNSTL